MDGHIRDILAVNEDTAAVHVVETGDQVDDGAFSCSGRSYQSDTFSGFYGERDVFQDLFAFIVGEAHMVEGDLAADLGHFPGIFLVGDGYRLIHGLKDTFQVGDVVDEVVENVSEIHDGLPEKGSITGNCHNGSKRFVPFSEKHKAEEKDRSPDADGDGVNAWPHQVGVTDSSVPGLAAVVGKLLENPGVFVLAGENLGDPGAYDVFLQVGIQVGIFVGNGLPGFSLTVLDPEHEDHENGDATEHHKSHLHIYQKHEDHDKKQVEAFQQDIDKTVGEHVRDRVYIVDYPDQDFSMRTVVVILEGQLLQVCEKIFSYVINDALAHIHHDLAADRCEDHADGIDADQRSHQRKQQAEIFVGDRHIQSPLDDHGSHIAEGSADPA